MVLFFSARTLVQQKRMIQTWSLDFMSFLSSSFFFHFFLKSETAKSHLSLCFASSWGGVVWCPTSFCSFLFFSTLFSLRLFLTPPSRLSFFSFFFALVYNASTITHGSLFRFACCRNKQGVEPNLNPNRKPE